jgi:HD-GYP domain-containing protein (c-di-GMP phosphodiesterase class II)
MRLMATGRGENEGRFTPSAARVEDRAAEVAYGGMVLERLARHTCRIAGVDWSCLFVLDRRDPRRAIAAAGCGVPDDLIGTRVGADEGVVGQVLASGQPALLADHRHLIGPASAEDESGRSGAAVAIFCGDAVSGVLCAAVKRGRGEFDPEDLEVLGELADLAGAALEHSMRHQHFDAAVHAQVDALAAAMDMRDQRTARHSDDVVGLARRVGALLDLETTSMLELEFAARLHDVGKIQVPDAVLNKPGPLEPHENEVIRCHATWGSETLAKIPGLEAVATIVRFHHERWDGAGYPDGLSGDRIPLASRIISVCDAYGAMTCDRPYRSALDPDDALEEIRSGSGSQFDPSVVHAFVAAVAAAA